MDRLQVTKIFPIIRNHFYRALRVSRILAVVTHIPLSTTTPMSTTPSESRGSNRSQYSSKLHPDPQYHRHVATPVSMTAVTRMVTVLWSVSMELSWSWTTRPGPVLHCQASHHLCNVSWVTWHVSTSGSRVSSLHRCVKHITSSSHVTSVKFVKESKTFQGCHTTCDTDNVLFKSGKTAASNLWYENSQNIWQDNTDHDLMSAAPN